MIYYCIEKLATFLNDHLRIQYKLQRDIVKIQPIEENPAEGYVSVTIANIERDTSSGIGFGGHSISLRQNSKSSPPWAVNVYILVAVVFPPKKYQESLKIVSSVLKVLQSNHIIHADEFGLKFSLEPVNLNFSELSNLWSISKGGYYPSVVCKMRTFEIDGDNILRVETLVENREINVF